MRTRVSPVTDRVTGCVYIYIYVLRIPFKLPWFLQKSIFWDPRCWLSRAVWTPLGRFLGVDVRHFRCTMCQILASEVPIFELQDTFEGITLGFQPAVGKQKSTVSRAAAGCGCVRRAMAASCLAVAVRRPRCRRAAIWVVYGF